MSGLVLPQLLKEEYPSYPGTAPAAPSLEQEAKSIWEKNREYLEGFKNDILTSEPRSKEFRFAIRVAKHFFRTDNTYDASGVAEALQFIDVIRKRHEAVVATSAERQLLQSVRKVLSVIFQHHHKFNDPRDLQKIIMAYNTFHNRCLIVGAEAPNPPFNNPYNTNLSMAIDPALTNSTEPQRPVIRPPPHLSQSPVHHSDLSSPTPLRSTDPATFLSFFDQSSTSNGLALPFQIEHQLSMNEVTVEQPLPTGSVRPPNRVASLLMRAMAAKKAAQIEAPVVEPSDPIVASTGPVVAPSDPIVAPADPIAALIQMEDFQDPEDAEMQAGEPPLEEDMVFQWTLPPEPVSSSPQKKEPVVVEDTPMETLAPEVVQDEVPDVEEPVMEDTQMETLVPEDTQDEVPDVEEPKLEGEDDVTESSLTNVSTPSLPHPDPPATEPEPELPEVIQPSPLSEELREELHEAVRPIVTYFQAKSDNGAVNSQATDESLVARYGPDLLRVAKEALDEIRTKYVIEEVKRSLNGSPTQEEDQLSDLFSEPDDMEPPVQEPVHSPPPPPQLDAEPESAVDELELADPPSTVEGLELTVSPSVAGEPELAIQMESEPAPLTSSEPATLTYSEQGIQTSNVAIQVVPAKEQTQLYETQETGIASYTVRDECCRTSFSFEIAPEFYDEIRTDRTAKIIATCSQELSQNGQDPIDDSWILMRINWTGNPDAEFLLVPNKFRNALTKVEQVIPLGVVERVNRLDLRRSWCAGGLRGLRVDIKVAKAVRKQRKRGREALDGESQEDADSEALGPFVDTFKRARI